MIVRINHHQGQLFYLFRLEQMVLPATRLLDIAVTG